MNPVYILTNWVFMLLRDENVAPGTGVDGLSPTFSALYKILEMKTKRSITTYNFTRV